MGISTKDNATLELAERVNDLEKAVLDLTTGIEVLENTLGENVVVMSELTDLLERLKREAEDD